MVRLIAGELKGKQPERAVEFHVAPGVKAVGDDRLLRIALSNLLANAWKFTGKHPRARIKFGLAREELGMNLYVQKPVRFDDFLAVARRIGELLKALKP